MSDRSQAQAEWIRSVLREHEAPLLRYALRLTGDAESARDIVQETFMRVVPGRSGDDRRICRTVAVPRLSPASTRSTAEGGDACPPVPVTRSTIARPRGLGRPSDASGKKQGRTSCGC